MAARKPAAKKKDGVTISRNMVWVIVCVVLALMVFQCGVTRGRSGAMPNPGTDVEVSTRG